MPRKRITRKDREMSKNAHEKILILLEENNLDQKEIGPLIGRSSDAVSRCLSSNDKYKGRDFTISEYADIAQRFGISLNDLFDIPNPVETSVPETARDACRMLVDIAKSNYRYRLKRDDDGYIYMYYSEIFPEDALRSTDPAAVSTYYSERHAICEFLNHWNDLISNFYHGSITEEQYNKILEDYLKEVPDDDLEEDDHQKFVEWMSHAAEHSEE